MENREIAQVRSHNFWTNIAGDAQKIFFNLSLIFALAVLSFVEFVELEVA